LSVRADPYVRHYIQYLLASGDVKNVEQYTALLNWNQEGFRCWLQLMHCAHLVLLSEYFGCVPGTLRIPEVLGEVQEFGSESGTGVLSRERGT